MNKLSLVPLIALLAMRALGTGGPKDAVAALQLYTKACNLGSRDGCLNAGIDPAMATIQIKK